MLSHPPQRCMPLHVPLCWRTSPLRLYLLCRSLLFHLRVCYSLWKLQYCPFLASHLLHISGPGSGGCPLGPPPCQPSIYPRPPWFHYAGHPWQSWGLAVPQDRRVDFVERCAYCWSTLPPSCRTRPAHLPLLATIVFSWRTYHLLSWLWRSHSQREGLPLA